MADELSFAGATRAKIVDLARGFWADAPRVMPLGDSNTLGLTDARAPAEFEGYRGGLWDRVVGSRSWIDYVGGRSNGSGALPDLDHVGVSGIRATQVLDQVADHAARFRPDVTLLMLGTNDALNEANAADTVPGELLAMMREIDAVRPGSTILLTRLPPIDPSAPGYDKRADAPEIRKAINAQLRDLVETAQAEGIDARLTKVQGLGKSKLEDGVHPTEAGYDRLAKAWFEAMKDDLKRGDLGGPRTETGEARDVVGSAEGDYLRGDGGRNRLDGGGGDDRIEGGKGRDVLTGGAGADVFVWRKPGHGNDRIADFSDGDMLEFSAARFGGGLVPGVAPILRSGAAPEASGRNGQFLYETERGWLSWDRDGNGDAPAAPIARLRTAPALSADEFLIV